MASTAKLELWTDRAAEQIRIQKERGNKPRVGLIVRRVIRGAGILHRPDVERLAKDIISRLQQRSTAARKARASKKSDPGSPMAHPTHPKQLWLPL